MAFNAYVTDGFVTRISETAGFAGLQNCGGEKHRKGRSRASAHARPVFFVARTARKGR